MPSARRHLAALGSCLSGKIGLSAGGVSVGVCRFECAIILIVGHGLGALNHLDHIQGPGLFRGLCLCGPGRCRAKSCQSDNFRITKSIIIQWCLALARRQRRWFLIALQSP